MEAGVAQQLLQTVPADDIDPRAGGVLRLQSDCGGRAAGHDVAWLDARDAHGRQLLHVVRRRIAAVVGRQYEADFPLEQEIEELGQAGQGLRAAP